MIDAEVLVVEVDALMEESSKEVKVIGVNFDEMMQSKEGDRPDLSKVVRYLGHTGKIRNDGSVHITHYRQLGDSKVTKDKRGNDRPRSAPLVVRFSSKEGRANFWKDAFAAREKCWFHTDSDQARHKKVTDSFRKRAAHLRTQGMQVKVNIKKEREIGFRYAVWRRENSNDEWILDKQEELECEVDVDFPADKA